MRRQRLLAAVFGIALGASAPLAHAQNFPDRTIKIIVPTSPGGAIDATARIIGEKLQAKWGKPVVVENKPGASMQIGAEAVAKSAPDGYTLLVAHDGTMAINPLVYPQLAYDPQKSFVPLGLVISIPEVVMVNIGVPAKSLAELIALAKKQPGQLTHATGGSATLLSLELFKAMAGVDIRSIQYRGAAQSVTAGIAGETTMVIADLTSAGPGLHSDRIRPLAVTSLTRSKQYPDLGTVNELGVPGYEVNTWMGRVRAGRHAEGRRRRARGGDQRSGSDAGGAGAVRGDRRRDAQRHRRGTADSACRRHRQMGEAGGGETHHFRPAMTTCGRK